MNAADYILDGLAAALELERELGVRSVECDRSLLAPAETPHRETRVPRASDHVAVSPVARPPLVARAPAASRPVCVPPAAKVPDAGQLIFLHDRPLSPGGVEMMAKIIVGLGRTAENTPIVVAPPVPKAAVTVILGGRAMKMHFPDMRGEPGQWIVLPDGREVLITYSPEYILRFGKVTPAVQKMKQDMWRSLKAVVQKLR